MTDMVTIKLPVDLRDRLLALARRQGITMVEVLERGMDLAESAAGIAKRRIDDADGGAPP